MTLFHHYIVNESGHTVADMIDFLKQCLLPVFTTEEKTQFFRQTLS